MTTKQNRRQQFRRPIHSLAIIPMLLALGMIACNADGAKPEGGGDDLVQEADTTTPIPGVSQIMIAFYNTENLFDTEDDPETDDDDYTPNGTMKWDETRLTTKLENIARAIRSMNDNNGPDIIGLCEVENRDVLERLVNDFLPKGVYGIVHTDSPDGRGIDVALLYRKGIATPGRFILHPVPLDPSSRPTRGVLEVPFTRDGQTFTILVNHWPSRSGGEEESEPKRFRAAATVASIVDSLYAINDVADIVVIGDFNDEPTNHSVHDLLRSRGVEETVDTIPRLYNLAATIAEVGEFGSYLYEDDWEVLDQIMISPAARGFGGLSMIDTDMQIFAPDFLRDFHPSAPLNPPRRTFVRGTLYIGGTSDHFPVFARFGWSAGR